MGHELEGDNEPDSIGFHYSVLMLQNIVPPRAGIYVETFPVDHCRNISEVSKNVSRAY